jgi:nitroimidazol reductase NimA-like FMN-containing flavoprotein (pyridoxamine 5'-phosphate oxidase superfamily)
MGTRQYSDLTEDERDEVLGRNEAGVLALASGDDPYAIPISYGYDGVERRFYVQLVTTDDSEKQRFLGATTPARLVVTEHREGDYSSVIADGTLTRVFRDELSVEEIHQYGGSKRPLLEAWGEDEDVELYELDPETLTGRRFGIDLRRD